MNYFQLIKKHERELSDHRDNCSHDPSKLIIRYDWSVVGRGSGTPSIHIVCPHCGKKKIMFRYGKEEFLVKIERTLEVQEVIRDQRVGLYVQYDYEIEPSKDLTFDIVNAEIEKLFNREPKSEVGIWESPKGVWHGTPIKGDRTDYTLCGIPLYSGWGYRGTGIPSCKNCQKRLCFRSA